MQEFHFASSHVKMKLINIFASSFYGSGLWNLFSTNCDRLYKSWNVAVRVSYEVPPTTHRYLIEPLSGMLHAKSMLCTRLVKFTEQLSRSRKPVVNLLTMLSKGDRRTTLGKNLGKIRMDLGGLEPSCNNIRKHMSYFAVPEEELWRISFLKELQEVSRKERYVENISDEEAKMMMNALCID